jgi:hypothetical protein
MGLQDVTKAQFPFSPYPLPLVPTLYSVHRSELEDLINLRYTERIPTSLSKACGVPIALLLPIRSVNTEKGRELGAKGKEPVQS